MNFSRISAQQAQEMIAQKKVNLVDIRDEQNYQLGHIAKARHVDNQSIADFIENTEKNQPLIVCCYHGNSSQSAAQFFAEQAFVDVYSLDGGYELWKTLYPEDCESGALHSD